VRRRSSRIATRASRPDAGSSRITTRASPTRGWEFPNHHPGVPGPGPGVPESPPGRPRPEAGSSRRCPSRSAGSSAPSPAGATRSSPGTDLTSPTGRPKPSTTWRRGSSAWRSGCGTCPLPDPVTALRRQAQLGTPRHHHSTIKSEAPLCAVDCSPGPDRPAAPNGSDARHPDDLTGRRLRLDHHWPWLAAGGAVDSLPLSAVADDHRAALPHRTIRTLSRGRRSGGRVRAKCCGNERYNQRIHRQIDRNPTDASGGCHRKRIFEALQDSCRPAGSRRKASRHSFRSLRLRLHRWRSASPLATLTHSALLGYQVHESRMPKWTRDASSLASCYPRRRSGCGDDPKDQRTQSCPGLEAMQLRVRHPR
jgi:hypothetical protein